MSNMPAAFDDDGNMKDKIKNQIAKTKNDIDELGVNNAFKTGEWLWNLIQKTFKSYLENANYEYFQTKYKTDLGSPFNRS